MNKIFFFLLIASLNSFAFGSLNPFAVEDVRSCGGSGQFHELRIPGCSAQPCQFYIGEVYPIEFDFRPAEASSSIRLTVLVSAGGIPGTIIDQNLDDSAVTPGQDYTLFFPLRTDNQLPGIVLNIQAHLTATTGTEEVCIQFQAMVNL